MTYAKKYGLQTGDQIVTPLFATGFSKHFSVYLGFKKGIEWIAENHKVHGVRVISAYQYFRDVTVISRVDKFQGSRLQQAGLMKKAESLVGTPYNLVSYNCEHFATQITVGLSESRQIKFAVVALIAALMVNFCNKS